MYQSILIIFFSFAFFINDSVSQLECATYRTPESFARLKSNVAETHMRSHRDEQIFIPIHFHLVGRDDGTIRIARSRALESLCRVNENFEELGFVFYIDTITNINDQSLFSILGEFGPYLKPSVINVFLLNIDNGGAGYYDWREDFIVLKRNFGTQSFDDGYTFEHELGHYFSLEHTHSGWEDLGFYQEEYGDTITMEFISSNQSQGLVEIELVDGSNCLQAGDGICDTPPDYGFTSTPACQCCEMIFDVWDRNFDKVEAPMSDNIMAYSKDCGSRSFTETQLAVMDVDYHSSARAGLRDNVKVDTFIPIIDKVIAVGPQGALDTYNGFLFSWNEITNANGYLLELNSDGQIIEYITADTELFVSDLEPNKVYTWSVIPFNRFGSGCIEKDENFFVTGGGTTDLENIHDEQSFSIFPNPTEGETILSFSNHDKQLINISILSLQGKLVSASQTNSSSYTFSTNDLSPGIYFAVIQNLAGSYSILKFIKQ